MQNIHGKEIDLLRVTVKVPGKRPPRAVPAGSPASGLNGVVSSPDGASAGEPLSWTSRAVGQFCNNRLCLPRKTMEYFYILLQVLSFQVAF